MPLKKVGYRIYLIAVAAQLLAVLAVTLLRAGTPASDPWYLWQAEALVRHGTWTTEWENPAFAIQEGSYENWRPPAYSVLVAGVKSLSSRREALIIVQVFIYALIPVLLFRVALLLFHASGNRESLAVLSALLWICNPHFLLSSLQILDTMLITLLVLVILWGIEEARVRESDYLVLAASAGAGVFYLLRPTGMIAFGVLLIWFIVQGSRNAIMRRAAMLLAGLVLPVLFWGGSQALLGSGFHIGYSSMGYNLWLGNNAETLPFLRATCGDAATIEDRVIPGAEASISDLAGADEFARNSALTSRALAWANMHPEETLKGIGYKILGFWSPFRNREGHHSQSTLKEGVVLAYQVPLLLLFLVSLISLWGKRELRRSIPRVGMLLGFISLWMLPLLPFFTTPRFRIPVDALILMVAVLVLPRGAAKAGSALLGLGKG